MDIVAIAVGGVVGAALRWAALTTVPPGRFPWTVLAINTAGSLLLGALLAESAARPAARRLLRDAGGIGFCGGLTTFSTFSLEVGQLARAGDTGTAAAYAVASVVAALVGVVIGAEMVGRFRPGGVPAQDDQPGRR